MVTCCSTSVAVLPACTKDAVGSSFSSLSLSGPRGWALSHGEPTPADARSPSSGPRVLHADQDGHPGEAGSSPPPPVFSDPSPRKGWVFFLSGLSLPRWSDLLSIRTLVKSVFVWVLPLGFPRNPVSWPHAERETHVYSCGSSGD